MEPKQGDPSLLAHPYRVLSIRGTARISDPTRSGSASSTSQRVSRGRIIRGIQAGLVASPAETDAGNRAKLEAAVAGSVPTDRPATPMSGTPGAERRRVYYGTGPGIYGVAYTAGRVGG